MHREVGRQSVTTSQVLSEIFVRTANVPINGTPSGRLVSATAMLTALTVGYLFIWLYFLDKNGIPLLRWLADLWPWTSDNFRSFRSKGTGLFLLCAPIPCAFWWRIGRGCSHLVGASSSSASDRAWSFVLFFSLSFVGPVISMKGSPSIALILATTIIWSFWRAKKKSLVARA